MTAFARSNDLRGAEFIGADLRGARFAEADLSGVVMRGVNAEGVDIDDPFLGDGGSFLRVNGVDVIPFVEAELNRRFPGRAARRAEDPDGLRAAWAALERAWSATLARVAMVRDFLAAVTPDVLAAPRKNPHDPGRPGTVRSCLHVILKEEWEHLRYAVRDLDALEAK
jgi:hypothetical protein